MGADINKSFRDFFSQQEFGELGVTPAAKKILEFLQKEVSIRRFNEYGRAYNAPVFYIGLETISGEDRITGVGINKIFGRALFSSILEFLERFVLLTPPQPNLIYQDVDSLRSSHINYCDFSNINAIIKKSPDTERTKFYWVRGRALFSEEEILLPAQAVFWNYRIPNDREPQIGEPNVNGTGGAMTKEKAILFGIYELVERDAFLLHWLTQKIPPRIDLKSIHDPEARYLILEAEKRNLAVHILDITSDIEIPTFMVVFQDRSRHFMSRGFSSNLNPMIGIKKALYETWGNYILNSYLLGGERRDDLSFVSNSRTSAPKMLYNHIRERYNFWINPDALQYLMFLLEGPLKPLNMHPETQDEVNTVLNVLKKAGIKEIFSYAPEHGLLKLFGFFVAKIIIPDLIPLYFKEENAYFAYSHKRLGGKVKTTLPPPFA